MFYDYSHRSWFVSWLNFTSHKKVLLPNRTADIRPVGCANLSLAAVRTIRETRPSQLRRQRQFESAAPCATRAVRTQDRRRRATSTAASPGAHHSPFLADSPNVTVPLTSAGANKNE